MFFNSYNIPQKRINRRRADFRAFLLDVPFVVSIVCVVGILSTLVVLAAMWITESF